MKKRILIVHYKMVLGGVEKVLLNMLNQIDYDLYDVDLYLRYGGGILQSQINPRVNVTTLEDISKVFRTDEEQTIAIKLFRRVVGIKNYYKILFRHLYTNSYDIAISFLGLDKLCDLFAGVSNAKMKYIWVHGDFLALSEYTSWFRRTFNIDKYKYDLFDKVICVSASSKDSFIKLHDQSEVDFIWNFIDVEPIVMKSNEPCQIELSGEYKIVFVGRFVHDKNLPMLIDAIKIVKDQGFQFRLYLIGDGPLLSQITEQVNQLELADCVVFLMEQNNPYNIVKQSDLLVLPSRNEGFPTVLLESLILHIPFVATDVCGSRDISMDVAPKNASILVEKEPFAIAKGIIDAIEGKVSKSFSFDGNRYNDIVKQKFESVIFNQVM